MAKTYTLETILGFILAATLWPAKGYAISKIDFEQRTRVIVWDIGSQRGSVDAEDDLTDIDEECRIPDNTSNPDRP